MTTISLLEEGRPAILLAHIFVTEQGAEAIKFEVLESEASSLRSRIGTKLVFTCDGDAPFWGEIQYLKACVPTAPGLARLADRPVVKGAIKIYLGEPNSLQ